MGKAFPQTFHFHIQASYWIGERSAFNTSSFETNQIQKLELNSLTVTSLYFLKLRWLIVFQGEFVAIWSQKLNILISHTTQPHIQMRTQDYLLLLSMILILLQFDHEFIKTYFTLLYPSLHQRDFPHLINKQKIIIILWSQAFASQKHLQNSVRFSIYI